MTYGQRVVHSRGNRRKNNYSGQQDCGKFECQAGSACLERATRDASIVVHVSTHNNDGMIQWAPYCRREDELVYKMLIYDVALVVSYR